MAIVKQSYRNVIDYEKHLNPQQLEAVTAPNGPILVIAGAGSGKTRTIVYRVAWLVESGIDPSSILLLTFTRKAAEEMLRRAAQLLDNRIHRVSGGTFHSLGNLLLRRYARLLGFEPSFSIMDQADSHDAIEHIRKTHKPALENPKIFPKARTIAEIFGRAVGSSLSIEEAMRKRYPHLAQYAPAIETIRKEYEAYKQANHMMDYDDLLLNTVKLLEEHEQVREQVSREWQHVLVDEYQDTNPLQAQIVRLIATNHDNVMVVGDDSQSIYSFRGADFSNIIRFPHLFPRTRIIKLEENYRSTAPILALTNGIIERATVGYPKRLFTRRLDGLPPLELYPETEREQSRVVVRCVYELVNNGIPLSEIAVLFRAGFHSFDLEGELHRSGIPYRKYGGIKFLEALHIKDVLAYLRVVSNPRDRLNWLRILRILPGVGEKTAHKLAGQLITTGLSDDSRLLVAPKKRYAESFNSLISLLEELKRHTGVISEKVEIIIEYYRPFLIEKYDNHPKRLRELETLADLAVPYTSLSRFLDDMALEPPDHERLSAEFPQESLVLSTIHSAKGLEWHTVILIWVCEGRLPTTAADSEEELEEERRLLYVAATRAKQNLVISAPKTVFDRRLGTTALPPSRFLTELPRELFRRYSG